MMTEEEFFGFGMTILMGLRRIVSLIAFQRINHLASLSCNYLEPVFTCQAEWGLQLTVVGFCFRQQEHKQRSFV